MSNTLFFENDAPTRGHCTFVAALASCLCLLQKASSVDASLLKIQLCEEEDSVPEPVCVLAFCQFRLQSSDALLQVVHLRRATLLRSCCIRGHGSLHSHLSDLARISGLHCTSVGAQSFHQKPTGSRQGL